MWPDECQVVHSHRSYCHHQPEYVRHVGRVDGLCRARLNSQGRPASRCLVTDRWTRSDDGHGSDIAVDH